MSSFIWLTCAVVLALGMLLQIDTTAFAASPGDINTIAGGWVGDVGAATSAGLAKTNGVTVNRVQVR